MKRTLWVGGAVVLIWLFATSIDAGPSTRDAMRLKLDYARGALEGLVLDKLELTVTNAMLLRNLNQTNAFTITGNRAYRSSSTNFLRQVDVLIQAAKAGNQPRAAEAYADVTRGCIECHKVFRHEQFLKAQDAAAAAAK